MHALKPRYATQQDVFAAIRRLDQILQSPLEDDFLCATLRTAREVIHRSPETQSTPSLCKAIQRLN